MCPSQTSRNASAPKNNIYPTEFCNNWECKRNYPKTKLTLTLRLYLQKEVIFFSLSLSPMQLYFSAFSLSFCSWLFCFCSQLSNVCLIDYSLHLSFRHFIFAYPTRHCEVCKTLSFLCLCLKLSCLVEYLCLSISFFYLSRSKCHCEITTQ